MHPVVDVQCPECRYGSRIEFRRLGCDVLCPGCQKKTVPKVPVGGSYPDSDWELTFANFAMLVQEKAYRKHVEPLLSSWFGYRIIGVGLDAQIIDSEGKAVDFFSTHLKIQDDDQKQLSLYRTAMALWR